MGVTHSLFTPIRGLICSLRLYVGYSLFFRYSMFVDAIQFCLQPSSFFTKPVQQHFSRPVIIYSFTEKLSNATQAKYKYTLCLKKVPTFKLSVTLSNLNRFSKFLHCWKIYEILYRNHTTVPISP